MELDPSKIDPKYLKVSYPALREGMSRRDLLFGVLKPKYEVVPAVEVERCSAWRGCSLCVACCPQDAISVKEAGASIDKDTCTACGACLPSCPNEAITSPLLSPEVLDASLESLFCREETDIEPKVLLITTEDADTFLTSARESIQPQTKELKLPCIGALSPWLLLRVFDLGADGVAIVPCGSTCRHRCEVKRWQQTICFVRGVLVKLGMEPRIGVFPVAGEEPQPLTELLQAFVEQVKEIGPSKLVNGKGREKRLTLVAILKGLSQRFYADVGALSGDEIPFGFVKIKSPDITCTLCGACPDRCPTGAITLQEGADLSQLLFEHSRCTACEACVRVCPEQVLRMERALDFSRLEESTILAEDRMAHCQRCGKEIAPLSMIRKVQHQFEGRKTGTASSLSEFCPDCRIFVSLDLKEDRPGQ